MEPGSLPRPIGCISYFRGTAAKIHCSTHHPAECSFWVDFAPMGYNAVISQCVQWLDLGRTMSAAEHRAKAMVMMEPLREKRTKS